MRVCDLVLQDCDLGRDLVGLVSANRGAKVLLVAIAWVDSECLGKMGVGTAGGGCICSGSSIVFILCNLLNKRVEIGRITKKTLNLV